MKKQSAASRTPKRRKPEKRRLKADPLLVRVPPRYSLNMPAGDLEPSPPEVEAALERMQNGATLLESGLVSQRDLDLAKAQERLWDKTTPQDIREEVDRLLLIMDDGPDAKPHRRSVHEAADRRFKEIHQLYPDSFPDDAIEAEVALIVQERQKQATPNANRGEQQ